MNNLDNIIDAKIQQQNRENDINEEEKSNIQRNNDNAHQDLEHLEKLSDCSAEIPSEHEDGIEEQSENKQQILICQAQNAKKSNAASYQPGKYSEKY